MSNINDAFPSNYLKASDLGDRVITVTIDRIDFEPVGQTKEMKPVLYFVGKEKGLVLNKTNANTISRLVGSVETEDWHGTTIRIYPTETSFQGDMVPCIRVKSGPPASPTKPSRAAVTDSQLNSDAQPMTDDDVPF